MSKTIQEFVKSSEKELGENIAFILDDEHTIKTDVIPTGIEVIDEAIGVGGIPRGRITEVFGAEGTGKTSICLQVIAKAQELGSDGLFIDAENAIVVDRIKKLGVDTSKLVISQPDSGEQALELVELACRSGRFSVIVVDSVAALVPQTEVDKDMGDNVMGRHAMLMSQAMRKLSAPVRKYNVALIFTNQVRTKFGFFPTDVTTGGRALQFYASLRLRMQSVGQVKNSKGTKVAGKYKVTIVKNKLAVPYKEAFFEIGEDGLKSKQNKETV